MKSIFSYAAFLTMLPGFVFAHGQADTGVAATLAHYATDAGHGGGVLAGLLVMAVLVWIAVKRRAAMRERRL